MNANDDLERFFRERILEDVRPWGKFRAYPYELGATVKIITVEPGRALSLQVHRRRAEFWVALDPGLEVTVGDRVWSPAPNEEIFIPRESIHRLRGLGPLPARVMEIWIGDPDESDIVRIQDDFGR
jgi:mannose-6-phosphate isomerase-like protein (cupin superfamily)